MGEMDAEGAKETPSGVDVDVEVEVEVEVEGSPLIP